jgi:hypothetical protein
MAITATTLTSTINAYQTRFALTATTGATAPVSTTGSGYTYLYMDNELMFVTAVPSTTLIDVIRGVGGTQAVAHTTSVGVLIGGVTDFPLFTPQITAFQVSQLDRYDNFGPPVAAAATIVAPSSIFHVTGVTATNIITPPTNFVGGKVTIIADGTWTWTSSNVANGIATSGLVTTGSTSVDFYFDPATSRWYPSRRA